MSFKDDVIEIIDNAPDMDATINKIMSGSKNQVAYVVRIGVEKIKSVRRRERRHELKVMLKPEFIHGKKGVVSFSKKSRDRLIQFTRDLYAPDGWDIGDVNISNFTKEDLLARADVERKSADGAMLNVYFYEALAAPMAPGQKVKDYWNPKTAGAIYGGAV